MADKGKKKSKGKGPRDDSAAPTKSKSGKELRGIVRLAGKDIRGHTNLINSLSQVKGIGNSMSRVVAKIALKEMKLSPDTMIGELDEKQMEQLEGIISNPGKHGVPTWMLNRRKDMETGEDKHIISNDLTYAIRKDVERERNMNSWVGYRHNYGQKVRGQRTRTTGRHGLTMGVIRKSIAQKAGAAAKKQVEKKK